MFIPYRCEGCIYGIYNHEDSCYENGCFASNDDECEKLFQEKCSSAKEETCTSPEGKRGERWKELKECDDLISRSALMQSLRNNLLVDVTPNLEQAIEEQPVAYDVDEVVERLEVNAAYLEEPKITRVRMNALGDLGPYVRLEDAVTIVKTGMGTDIEEKEECSSAKEET